VRTLWHGTWIETPAYAPVPPGRLLEVERSAALARIPNPSGRAVIERPGLKVRRFLVTDGPRATYRKARAKLAQREFSGDYHLTAVLGRCVDSGRRFVCIGCRLPACADFLLVHDGLCAEVQGDFSLEQFERFVGNLAGDTPELLPLSRQSYLYSGLAPPIELRAALDRALKRQGDPRKPVEPGPFVVPPGRASPTTSMSLKPERGDGNRMPVAVLGAGEYVRAEVRAALQRGGVEPSVLCDREPQVAALAARQMGFRIATTDAGEAINLLGRPGLVIVATNHDSHARLASLALESGHRVLLEKPAVVTAEDLERLLAACSRTPGRLEVGFNRRYNSLLRRARSLIAQQDGPATVVCTVREVGIESDHWYLWPNQGTRVTGNLCHWIDVAIFLTDARADPVSVTVSPPLAEGVLGVDAERTFSIAFDDGSMACLTATARGDGVRGVQETIEVRRGSATIRLDDLWRMHTLRNGRVSRRRTLWRDKGHQRMYCEALTRFKREQPATYPTRDLALVCAIQLAAAQLAESGESTCEMREQMADLRRRWPLTSNGP
jgi:predicted dehydrogenase